MAGAIFVAVANARLGGSVKDLLTEPLVIPLGILLWPAWLASYLGGFIGR